MKRALILSGGWEGHQPIEVGQFFDEMLKADGFETELIHDPELLFTYGENLSKFDLFVPCWTMGTLSGEAEQAICGAVRNGLGIAGCHGGMCDAFRASTEWQFMTGGQFAAHPGDDGTEYWVHIKDKDHDVTRGMEDFIVSSEQYYMQVDPAIKVLATCSFPVADGPHVPNGKVEMPVIWTKLYGKGKVFYCSLGHNLEVVRTDPMPGIMERGFTWAARS